jgi:hypothetical protein
MAFKQVGSLDPQGAPILRKVILANSVASVAMDSVKASSGFCALGTAGALVLGHVVSHVSKEGVGLLTTGVAGASIGSYAGAFTAASDNQTVAMVAALVDMSKNTLYSESTDGTFGTTSGSNLFGNYTDIADEDSIDENNATNAFTTPAQYLIWGVNPAKATEGIYSIYESQIFGV